MGRLLCVIFLANSSENAVRAAAECELLRVQAAAVGRLAYFFCEFIKKKVRSALGCELLQVRAARVVTLKNRRMWGEARSGRPAPLSVRLAARDDTRILM